MAAKKQSGTTMGLRLSEELKAALAKAASENSRTLHGHIVRTLEKSLEATAGDDRLSPWAREIGRLLASLADDLGRTSTTPHEALAAMKVGAPVLIDGLLDSFRNALGADEVDGAEQEVGEHAAAAARALAAKIRRARSPGEKSGNAPDQLESDAERYAVMEQPSLGASLEDLARLQKALHLPAREREPAKPTPQKRSDTKIK